MYHLTGHLGPVTSAAWNGSKIISGSQDKSVVIWAEIPTCSAQIVQNSDVEAAACEARAVGNSEANVEVFDGSIGSQGQVMELACPVFMYYNLTNAC